MADPMIAILVRQLEEAYRKPAWHGPNVKGLVRGLSAEAATWRPAPGRHNIRELLIHIAYWKYVVRRRLTGTKRGSFPLEGSDWFVRDVPDEQLWREEIALADAEHAALIATVESLRDVDLTRKSGKHDFAREIYGAATHDLYHAGQIALIAKMQ